jgi:hypothetical protein
VSTLFFLLVLFWRFAGKQGKFYKISHKYQWNLNMKNNSWLEGYLVLCVCVCVCVSFIHI